MPSYKFGFTNRNVREEDTRLSALEKHQMELERLYDKNQLIPRIKEEFLTYKGFDFAGYMKAEGIPKDFGIALLTQMVLHKRANVSTLVGCLRHYLPTCQDVANMLIKCAEAGLVEYCPNTRMFILTVDIGEEVQAELERFQYPLPMVVEPRRVTSNVTTGYLTTKESVLLRDNHHWDDICLDHLNRVNQMKLSINRDTAMMVKNRWRNLDKPKSGETKEDFEKRRRAFEKYDRSAKDVIKLLLTYSDEFYLTHRYDKRGRVYCMGYHVSYQAAPWNKAVIEFADKELVT